MIHFLTSCTLTEQLDKIAHVLEGTAIKEEPASANGTHFLKAEIAK